MRQYIPRLISKTCCRCAPTRATKTGSRCMSSAATQHVYKSPFKDEALSDTPIAEYMFSKFGQFGNKVAMKNDASGQTYNFSEIEPLCRNVGSYLTKQGLRKGDVVCYYGTNNPEFTILLLGCAAIGVIVTTANPAYTPDELSRQIFHSCAKLTVTTEGLVEKTKQAGVKNIVVIGNADGCQPFSLVLGDDGTAFPDNVSINSREDLAILPYSSGTTGLPKGVMLTHYNIVNNLIQFQKPLPTTIDDNTFGVLPFYHIYGMVPVMLGSIQNGSTLVTTPGFDPVAFLTAIQEQKISVLHIVPPIVLFLTKHPMVSKYDLSSLREVICAAAPLGEGLTNEFLDRHNVHIVQGYGLTETSPVVAIDSKPATVGSIGRLIPNTEVKILDLETGKSMSRNETGELCVRGPQIMKGYLNNEKSTRESIDNDGWLHTGDIGHIREDDCLVITDRLKELIKYKGLQIAPAELEDILQKHAAVQDVAVIGIPDERAGEVPRAFIVCKPETNPSEKDIMKFVEGHVAEYKHLRGGVEFVKEVPKSPSGKILRRVLRDQYNSS